MDANLQSESAPFNGVSLVVAAAGAATDNQIRQTLQSLGSNQSPTEVLIVDPHSVGLVPSVPVGHQPPPSAFPNWLAAIKAAQYDTILVADPQVILAPHDWRWIAQRRSATTVQSYFQKRRSDSFLRGLLESIFHLLVWLSLRVRKTKLDAGLIVLNRKLASQLSELSPNEAGKQDLSTSGILAIAKQQQIPLEEIVFERAVSDWNPEPASYRQIFVAVGQTLRFWWNQIMFPLPVQSDSGRQMEISTRWLFVSGFLLMVAAAGILLTNLDYPLFEPDEARNAQLAINIIESGDWLSLTLAEEPYWDKPPLQMWAIAASYKLFGISPLATRIPGVLATVLTILFTLIIGRRLVGFRPALLGSLLLILCSGFLVIGRYVTMDASLTCCVTVMTLALFAAAENRFTLQYVLLAGVAAGIGLLVKGPVILVLGLPPVIAAMWLSGSQTLLKKQLWLVFLAPAILIAAPWFLATALVSPDFVIYFFWKHHVVRFSDAFNHREPFWYYLPAIFIMMFPASYLFPSLIHFLGSRQDANRNLRTPAHGWLLLMSAWIVGFFSISESKLPTYILPALPPLCLLMGIVLDKKIFAAVSSGWQKLRNSGSVPQPFLEQIPKRNVRELLFIILTILIVCRLFLGANYLAWPLLAGCLFAMAAIAYFFRRMETHPKLQWYCAAWLSFCFVMVGVNLLAPQIARVRSNHAAAKLLQTESGMEDAPVVFFGRENYGAAMTFPKDKVFFYESEEADEVCEFLLENPNSILISSKDPMKNLRRMLNWTIVIDRLESARHLYQTRPNPDLIAREPNRRLMR